MRFVIQLLTTRPIVGACAIVRRICRRRIEQTPRVLAYLPLKVARARTYARTRVGEPIHDETRRAAPRRDIIYERHQRHTVGFGRLNNAVFPGQSLISPRLEIERRIIREERDGLDSPFSHIINTRDSILGRARATERNTRRRRLDCFETARVVGFADRPAPHHTTRTIYFFSTIK